MIMSNPKIKSKLNKLPDSPGVYLMLNRNKKIIYVGKAKSLKKRVRSYFSSQEKQHRIKLLVENIFDIDFLITATEAEALILEAALIKENKPKFNIEIKDDKAYPLLRLSTNEKFPRLKIVRRKKNDKSQYFGPYTSAKLLRQALNLMRRIFPLRTCNVMPKSVCLNYHLKQCQGPCQNLISKNDYDKIVANLLLFLRGRKKDLIKKLSKEMTRYANGQNFEKAIELRNTIESLSSVPVASVRYFLSDQIEDLKKVLRLKKAPLNIEGYDISNISGAEAVGSMVYFKKGKPYKNNYRRFKIKTITGIDDYAMMQEVLKRRFQGKLSSDLPLPDLIIIDGGKGHLHAASKQMSDLKINIPIISIAKKFEHIYVQWQEKPVALSLKSKALRLIISVRNEAHRFAIGFHRNMRKKQMLLSELDQIPGIGKKRKQILQKAFDDIKSLKLINIKQLLKIKGIDEKTAKNIIEHYQKY